MISEQQCAELMCAMNRFEENQKATADDVRSLYAGLKAEIKYLENLIVDLRWELLNDDSKT